MKDFKINITKIEVRKTAEETFIRVAFHDSIEESDNSIELTESWNETVEIMMPYKRRKSDLVGDLELRSLLNDIIGDYKRCKELGELGSSTKLRKFIIHELYLMVEEFNEFVAENCFEEEFFFKGSACSTCRNENKFRRRLSLQERNDIKAMS